MPTNEKYTKTELYSENHYDDHEYDFDLVFGQPSTTMQWILKSSFNEFTACTWLRPTTVQRSPVAVLSMYKRESQLGAPTIIRKNGVKIAADFSGHREVSVQCVPFEMH